MQGDWVLDYDECGHVFRTKHIQDDLDYEWIIVKCPKCGFELTQYDDCPEVVKP